MPPKVKTTKENIVKAALDIIREEGSDAINARDFAARLGCSTQPIFSNFSSMEDLEQNILKAAHEIYMGFLEREAQSTELPRYKAFGMAYIRFAKEEKELFKLLFMKEADTGTMSETEDFRESVEYIMKSCGIEKEKAALMHLETWSAVHGIATMLATSFLPLEWGLISDMLSDIYFGLRKRHCGEV